MEAAKTLFDGFPHNPCYPPSGVGSRYTLHLKMILSSMVPVSWFPASASATDSLLALTPPFPFDQPYYPKLNQLDLPRHNSVRVHNNCAESGGQVNNHGTYYSINSCEFDDNRLALTVAWTRISCHLFSNQNVLPPCQLS